MVASLVMPSSPRNSSRAASQSGAATPDDTASQGPPSHLVATLADDSRDVSPRGQVAPAPQLSAATLAALSPPGSGTPPSPTASLSGRSVGGRSGDSTTSAAIAAALLLAKDSGTALSRSGSVQGSRAVSEASVAPDGTPERAARASGSVQGSRAVSEASVAPEGTPERAARASGSVQGSRAVSEASVAPEGTPERAARASGSVQGSRSVSEASVASAAAALRELPAQRDGRVYHSSDPWKGRGMGVALGACVAGVTIIVLATLFPPTWFMLGIYFSVMVSCVGVGCFLAPLWLTEEPAMPQAQEPEPRPSEPDRQARRQYHAAYNVAELGAPQLNDDEAIAADREFVPLPPAPDLNSLIYDARCRMHAGEPVRDHNGKYRMSIDLKFLDEDGEILLHGSVYSAHKEELAKKAEQHAQLLSQGFELARHRYGKAVVHVAVSLYQADGHMDVYVSNADGTGYERGTLGGTSDEMIEGTDVSYANEICRIQKQLYQLQGF